MNFILTFDYELFGDGSGNVFNHMIEPTEKLLNICERRNIKTTLFFEVVEYLKLKREWDNNNSMGYNDNPIEAIETQLQKAAAKGHDIQLHIHPQWVGAKFVNHKWEVDFSNWRFGSFREKEGYTIERLLQEGKTAIENIIRPVVPGYKCIALRAGGYNIMPSKAIYDAMIKTGLKMDSSVYPGGFETGELSNFDYRHVSAKLDHWWANPEDITRNSGSYHEILEIPVFALPKPRWRKMANIHRLKSMLVNNNSSASSLSKSKMGQKSIWNKIEFLLEKEAFTWDFFLFDSRLHNRFLSYIDNKLSEQRNAYVLIGHPKSPFNEKAFKKLIEKVNKRNGNFKTVAQFYDEVNSGNF